MIRFILAILLLVFIVTGCHGCSFIKEHFGATQSGKQQTEQQYPQEEQRKVEPIPINPQHS